MKIRGSPPPIKKVDTGIEKVNLEEMNSAAPVETRYAYVFIYLACATSTDRAEANDSGK